MFQMPAHIQQGTAEARAYFLTKRTSITQEFVSKYKADFDAFDRKGRRHGYQIVINREVYTRVAPDAPGGHTLVDDENLGEWFRVIPHALKDGQCWGAIPPSYRFRSKEEAMQKAEAILAKARKAAAKKV